MGFFSFCNCKAEIEKIRRECEQQILIRDNRIRELLEENELLRIAAGKKVPESAAIQIPVDKPELTKNAIYIRNHREKQNENQKRDAKEKDKSYQQEKRWLERFQASFVNTSDKLKVLSGLTSQCDKLFKFSPTCYGNALAAAAFKDPALWTPVDFKTVLKTGFEFYKVMADGAKKSRYDYLESSDAEHLKGVLTVGKHKFSFGIEPVPYQGPVDFVDEERADLYVPLDEAIDGIFQRFERALLVSNERWFCLATSEHQEGFFLINSHSVDITNTETPTGRARSFCCQDSKTTVEVIKKSLKLGGKSFYQLYGLNLTPLQEDSDNLIQKKMAHSRDDEQESFSDVEPSCKKPRFEDDFIC